MHGIRVITSILTIVILLVVGCDSVPDPIEREESPSHFTALLNGQRWETKVAEGGFTTSGINFTSYLKELSHSAYYQSVSVILPKRSLGTHIGSAGSLARLDSLWVRIFEADDHVLFTTYYPIEPPVLTLNRVDSTRGVVSGTLVGTFVIGHGNRSPFRQLPDTLRLREGAFTISLQPLAGKGR